MFVTISTGENEKIPAQKVDGSMAWVRALMEIPGAQRTTYLWHTGPLFSFSVESVTVTKLSD